MGKTVYATEPAAFPTWKRTNIDRVDVLVVQQLCGVRISPGHAVPLRKGLGELPIAALR